MSLRALQSGAGVGLRLMPGMVLKLLGLGVWLGVGLVVRLGSGSGLVLSSVSHNLGRDALIAAPPVPVLVPVPLPLPLPALLPVPLPVPLPLPLPPALTCGHSRYSNPNPHDHAQ